MQYVKICPRCGRMNHELSDSCEVDGEFLGMVMATPKPEVPEEVEEEACDEHCEPAKETSAAVEQAQSLYLEAEVGGQIFEVRDGDVVGQAHPTSGARVQLADLPGVSYVHRSHCSFSFIGDCWRVTALAQPGYTNPTFVNQQRLAPGDSCAIKNGDRLMLSNVTLTARIIEY